MEISKNVWLQAIALEQEHERRGEGISWRKIQDAFTVGEKMARGLRFALENKHIFKARPDVFPVNADSRVFHFCDVHIPYQDQLSVETALSYADRAKPDTIIINGDLIDFYKISRFVTNPAKHSVFSEIKQTRKFLEDLRHRFPDARIIYKQGNHEMRLENYIYREADQISDLLSDLLIQQLRLPQLNIEYMIEPFSYGKLWVLHGHEKPAGGNPEWICNVMWKYVHTHFIVGHFHRNQTKPFKDIAGHQYWTGACGYLAGKMDYALLNQWQHGFADMRFAANGKFRADVKTIVDGEIY